MLTCDECGNDTWDITARYDENDNRTTQCDECYRAMREKERES